MEPFYDNVERSTLENKAFRNVVYTDNNIQLAYMSLQPKEEIGLEVHPVTTQFIRVEAGTGTAIVNNHQYPLYPGALIIVPPNSYHNVINTSPVLSLDLYTVYSPPVHHEDTYEYMKMD